MQSAPRARTPKLSAYDQRKPIDPIPCLLPSSEMRDERRLEWRRLPVDVMKNQKNPQPGHTSLLSTTNSNSGSLPTSNSKVSRLCSVNKTMTGLHSQTYTGLHSRQPCLFQSKSRTPIFIPSRTVAFTTPGPRSSPRSPCPATPS